MPVRIDYKLCTGCKTCYSICPMDIFGWDEEIDLPYLAHHEECWHCGSCYFDCPKGAIDVTYPVSLW